MIIGLYRLDVQQFVTYNLPKALKTYGYGDVAEEVGHIFCARDYALRLNGNNCVFHVPNLASFVPKSIWPGTEGKRKLPMRSEATTGEFER